LLNLVISAELKSGLDLICVTGPTSNQFGSALHASVLRRETTHLFIVCTGGHTHCKWCRS